MDLKPAIDTSRYTDRIQVVNAHTAGEPCRVVTGGFPEPEGATMAEKKAWILKNLDSLRTALIWEPRGHHDMYGCLLFTPVNPEADFGIIFMETGGWLDMCGHCTIGAVTVILEAGLKQAHEGENEVVLDSPCGLVRTKAVMKNGKVTEVSFVNVPSFVYQHASLDVNGRRIEADIAYGGAFFALVDASAFPEGPIGQPTLKAYTDLGMAVLKACSEQLTIVHPELGPDRVELCEFYRPTPNPDKADMRNIVIFGEGSADRSPCGTGTCAKLALLYEEGQLKIGEPFVYESFLGSLFTGRVVGEAKMGPFKAVIPQVTGCAWITGTAEYLFDPTDPMCLGFSI